MPDIPSSPRSLVATAVVLALVVGALFVGGGAASGAEPSEVIRYFGDTSSATGAALAPGACDVDGDGYDDAIVGAWFWDKAPNNNVGAAYVLFGGPELTGGDLNSPEEASAARIDGPSITNAFVGSSVACLGDVNGDGIDDLAISYYFQERMFVVLGAEDFGSVDLGFLGERGFQVVGDRTGTLDDDVGFSIAPAGDQNGDGLADFAVAGVLADTLGRTNNGRVWIVAGKQDVADVDLIAPDPGEVLSILDGRGNEDRLGSVAHAGDVNGDGVEDLVVGAHTATPWGPSVAVPGAAWVIWGGGDGAVDLADLGDEGFAILGPQRQRDRLGISVAAAGDVNGDGLDDVLIGGDGVYNAATGQRTGSAWVVFGADSNATVHTATSPEATAAVYTCSPDDAAGTCTDDETTARGYWIVGADSDPGNGTEATGYSLSGIGDVDGDAIPDFAIGAPGYDPVSPTNPSATLGGAGAVWVVHGKTDTATQDLATLTPADGYRIDGLAAGDRFGRQVAGVGDLDGNGSGDFVGSGDFAQRPLAPGTPRTQAGEVAIALVGPTTSETALATNRASPPAALADEVGLTATVTRPAAAEASGTHESSATTGALATAGNDTVRLTSGPDQFRARAGDDVVHALAGDDRLWGNRGDDRLHGGPGDDQLRGGQGNDDLRGGQGNDHLVGRVGIDELRGGAGDDLLDARDGTADATITGGPGDDTCLVDPEDVAIADCEHVDGDLPDPPPPDPPPSDPPASDALANRQWQPTAYDTCPKALHDNHTVVGPDGRRYPSWHPPTTIDPATGQECTFGHEHGADPRTSDLFDWIAEHQSFPGHEAEAGIAFGAANEALLEFAAANPSTLTRVEDHVGHKVDVANNVTLLDDRGRYLETDGPGGQPVRVVCDYLTKVHQGSHSADATANNVHEVFYAARCNDGTEVISTTMARFGAPNEFARSCAPGTTVATSGAAAYPAGDGSRLLPDRGCVEQFVLVPPTAGSDLWALYENWLLEVTLTAASGEPLARFDPWWAVRNPSRYHVAGQPVGRPGDAAWETDPSDGGTANRRPWTWVSALDPFEYRDPRSPFDGAQRDFYLQDTEVTNAAGPTRWYTDPYGEGGRTTPAPGYVCQLVSATDNSAYPDLKRRLFGRSVDFGAGNGVHAPN